MLAVIPVRPVSYYTRSEGSSLEKMDARQGFPKVPVFLSHPPNRENWKWGLRNSTIVSTDAPVESFDAFLSFVLVRMYLLSSAGQAVT